MQRLAVFDLDGTLVHSAPDLAAALNRRLAAAGLPPLTVAEVQPMIGDGARRLLERGFAARGAKVPPDALAAFLADPALEGGPLTAPFPGMAELLERLAAEGWRLAVCTNKPEGPARALLGRLGLARHLRAIGGGDSFAVRKPDPAHLLLTIGAAGGGRAVMVGDHQNDMLAARGAGIPAIFVGWGYGPRQMALGHPVVADAAALHETLSAL
ncbi:MAG: HAD-IA family hydrolase [Rhodovarius sp.]|nr:HAD-IA family hydrolase [Rhodovarius sp.]